MNSFRTKAFGSFLLLSLFLVSGAKEADNSLDKIANYKNWNRATQQLAEGTFSIDPNSPGG